MVAPPRERDRVARRDGRVFLDPSTLAPPASTGNGILATRVSGFRKQFPTTEFVIVDLKAVH